MRHLTTTLGWTARRIAPPLGSLLVLATYTVVAHGGGGVSAGNYGGSGGMMGGGWGLFGAGMGLWGLLWMGLVVALPVLLLYGVLARRSAARADQLLSVLRERYARGELSDDEYTRRRDRLESRS